jgi:hypothetical protein
MSKLEDLNSEKFRLPEQVMKNVRGGKRVERTEDGKDGANPDGEPSGDDYSTAQGVTDHCDWVTPKRDWVEKTGPCGVAMP